MTTSNHQPRQTNELAAVPDALTIENVPLDLIEIGQRRRQDLGNVDALAGGIARVGLIEPVVVTRAANGRFQLVAGERRLRAVRMLHWQTIPANLLESLSDQELRAIELEENENRKPLTEQERQRTFVSSKRLVVNACATISSASRPRSMRLSASSSKMPRSLSIPALTACWSTRKSWA
jgi:ParB family chromosome partitioning protein